MKLMLVITLSLMILGCKTTPPSPEEIAIKKQEIELLKSRITQHYNCLDIKSMEFGDSSLLSDKKLKRLKVYETEFKKTDKHYKDLMEGKVELKKYLKHSKRLKEYGRDVFNDYLKVSDGQSVYPKILRGHYCERLLLDTGSTAFENKLKELVDFDNPNYEDLKSQAGLTVGKGLLSLVPSSSTVGWKHNRKAVNEKMMAADICTCSNDIERNKSTTHETLDILSDRLCKYTTSADYQNFLNREINVYKEKVKMRNLEIRSVDSGNIIYEYNESKKKDVEGFFKDRYFERALVNYIKELSSYLPAFGGSESDIKVYSCVMEANAKAENNLLY